MIILRDIINIINSLCPNVNCNLLFASLCKILYIPNAKHKETMTIRNNCERENRVRESR